MATVPDHNKPSVLIVDDPFRTFQSLSRMIPPANFSIMRVIDARKGLALLKKKSDENWIIIIDLNSPNMGGGGFMHLARQIVPRAAILLIGPLKTFLYQGGQFFKFSGANLEQNIDTILMGIVQKMGIARGLTAPPVPREGFKGIIGKSPSINHIYEMIENLKKSSATVLIQGESGTGKELVAQTIHQTSSRKNQPFIAVNCGAIPVTLIETELFGHERGAFTSAVSLRKGKFEIAQKGTLFLDEIGELSGDIQVKLLRVLQEKEFQRVGGNRTYKTDVRIIAASNKDLKSEMKAGRFREDLYYRLNVVPLHIPPLRERREDILPLLDHCFEKIFSNAGRPVPRLCQDAVNALLDYHYPGNVREMTNVVERLSITCPDGEITLEDLPMDVRENSDPAPGPLNMIKELPDGGIRLDALEKELILKTLEKTSGNKQAAAKVLGITRRLLYLRLSNYADTEDQLTPSR